MKRLSIGMFDSGIGGLTVLKEVKRLLPHEHIIYLGDSARVPYGNKSPQTVKRYALESAIFLLTKGIKALVIACNTSSAIALDFLKKKLPIPVVGVIHPAAAEAVRQTKKKRVGVIGTRATIESKAYENAIKGIDDKIEVISKACPLFVPIVEEGLEGDEIAFIVAERYLKEIRDSDIDVLVMGCTHYPIMETMISKALNKNVSIVNTGKETAKEIKDMLSSEGMLEKKGKGGCEYFVTDSPRTFETMGSRFLGEHIKRIKFLKSLDYKDYLLNT